MDNDSKSDDNCTFEDVKFTIIEGVIGSIVSVTCIVALVFVLVSRFYKDIIQRLILYKLVTVFIYSISQFLFLPFDESNVYRAFVAVPLTAFLANLIFTFWLTIILFICIVKLKKPSSFKKLEPVVIVTSLLSFVNFILIPFAHYDDCNLKWQIILRKGGENVVQYIIISSSLVGVIYFIMSILVIIIFITAIKRSQICKIRKTKEYESPVLADNKWRALSKQLLPIVVYPIINTGVTLIFLPLDALPNNDKPVTVFLILIVTSYGLITSITVILHLCILKCKKKQRERKKKDGRQSLLDYAEEVVHDRANENSAMFTSDTLASTNARTEYIYTRTSSFNESIY